MTIREGMENELLKNIGDNVKEERGKGVALTKAVLTVDPRTRNAIKEDCSFSSLKDIPDPITESRREAAMLKDGEERFPLNRVKSLLIKHYVIKVHKNGRYSICLENIISMCTY